MSANSSRWLSARVGLMFAFQFVTVGLYLPFFAIFLADRGFDDTSIGFILATPLAIRIAASPVITALADKYGKRGLALVITAGISSIGFFCFSLVDGFVPIMVTITLLSLFSVTILPLSDAYAMDTVRAGRGDYGRMRLWGSMAFVVTTLAGGAALDIWPSSILPYGLALSSLACAAVALTLPEIVSGEPATPVPGGPATSLRSPVFLVALFAMGLIQGSHATYYGFGSLHWQRAGITETVIGILWVIGVVVEIGLFAAASRLRRWLSPLMLVAIGGAAGVIRWTLFPFAEEIPSAFVLQLLHGLTFGATHLGMIGFIAEEIPARRAATAQGLASTFGGIATAVGTVTAGRLYSADPVIAFWCMGGGAALALLLLGYVAVCRRRQSAAGCPA